MTSNWIGKVEKAKNGQIEHYKGKNTIYFNNYSTRFGQNRGMWGEMTQIPFDDIFYWMSQLSCPVWGEYVEITENAAFNKVRDLYFEYLFWEGEAFIFYDEIEETMSMYQCNNAGKYQENGYLNIETQQLVHLTQDEAKLLIYCTWDGKYNKLDRFYQWYKFCYWMLVSEINVNNSACLLAKHFMINTEIFEGSSFDAEKEQLFYPNPYILKTPSSVLNTISVEKKFLTPDVLEQLVKTHFQFFDRKLSELGRTVNTNPKGERLTAGENYKDITGTAARERMVLQALKDMANEMEKLHNIKLEFVLNRPPEAVEEPSPGDINKADVMNVENLPNL